MKVIFDCGCKCDSETFVQCFRHWLTGLRPRIKVRVPGYPRRAR